MKKYILAVMAGALCIMLSGCQETPEESAVVSKADGISEAVVCEPLKEGEKRETGVPAHWEFEETVPYTNNYYLLVHYAIVITNNHSCNVSIMLRYPSRSTI